MIEFRIFSCRMAQSRIPSHIALYDSSYVILFDNGSWSSEGVPRSLFKKMHQATSNIEFVSLGPYKQCFLRLDNGEIFYYVKDRDTRDELKNSNDKPYKLWFSDDDGYILQYADLSLSWNNIPRDFHNKLNRRKKTLTRVENITFGCDNTWWVSFDDGTACWSQNIPSYINKHLKHTKYFVLDPYDRNNYYIFKEDGSSMWQVNDDFDDDINEEEEDDNDDVVYINPRRIRYTQTSISRTLI
ncbi:hypothetical protein I4U23_016041 [Adineta vaga]|nr:hypothetical protein I4U23_016041 [Adineta vaga]